MSISKFLYKAAFGLFAVLVVQGGAPAADLSRAVDDLPVVVELFTSQGCNSCPPADAYLRELSERDDIVALEFHVDYWDYIGWKDPFADPAFTLRQRRYAQVLDQRYVYTPQMVIDGLRHEIGSKRSAVKMAIKLARQEKPAYAPRLHLSQDAGDMSVRIEGGETPRPFDIVLIGFDEKHETDVTRGENAGRIMVNAHVVRSLERIGVWRGGDETVTFAANRFAGDGGCAVLLQERGGGRILAAASLSYN